MAQERFDQADFSILMKCFSARHIRGGKSPVASLIFLYKIKPLAKKRLSV
jgi:hypothetical protein